MTILDWCPVEIVDIKLLQFTNILCANGDEIYSLVHIIFFFVCGDNSNDLFNQKNAINPIARHFSKQFLNWTIELPVFKTDQTRL